ncbi:MAG: iron chelate uptake ABC transporter family permease subunit [Waddliaceae bacterium]
MSSPFLYFTDSILRAPTIGCMFMCLSSALVGVIAFLKKESLLGESISHASYPGVIAGVMVAGSWLYGNQLEQWAPLFTLSGALITALIGLVLIHQLVDKLNIHADSALCLILSTFFGVGLTLASVVQFTHSALYRQSLSYLYGQAATMTDIHILIYGILSLAIIFIVILFYKELQVLTFDRNFAKSIGIPVHWMDGGIWVLIALAVVLGIRSVGVVLMSAMLIAPAAAARQWTHRLSVLMILAAMFGLISGFLGNYLSVELTDYFAARYPASRLVFPTGPMIVIVATVICLLSLVFAPERGLLVRAVRIFFFRYRCFHENILKTMWRIGPEQSFSLSQIRREQHVSFFYLKWLMSRLVSQRWVKKKEGRYQLTPDGVSRAARIVHLHRLWEAYLAHYLGLGEEGAHRSAEEMEHLLTPELEKELTRLCKNLRQQSNGIS